MLKRATSTNAIIHHNTQILWLIWLYFWLLIFEGALRKWIFPQFSAPLLIVRDPVLLLCFALVFQMKRFPFNSYVTLLWLIGGFALVLGLMQEDLPWTVPCYGFRVNYLHPPLIFIMASYMKKTDLLKIGKACLIVILPMAVLMVIQFVSSPDAWINTTAGGEGEQIRATVGNIRPPATFSFVTGVAEFFPLVSAFLAYGILVRGVYSTPLLSFAATGLILGSVVSISRLTLTGISIVLVTALVYSVFKTRQVYRVIIYLCLVLFIIAMLSQFEVIQLGFSTFRDRIQAAGGAEGGWTGYLRRISGVFIDPFLNFNEVSIWGEGLGFGTAAGSALLTGKRAFLLAENEWSRIVFETGPILGFAFIAWRIGFLLDIAFKSIRCAQVGDSMPILLFAASFPTFLVGQWGRPTTLGFAIFETGLCLAACCTSNLRIGNVQKNIK
jgi:hypothetical protein